MNVMNMFSQRFGLRTFKNWSKVWEYPWLWYHALSKVNWLNRKVLDLGSELSPMPWFLASLGAEVTLVESDGRWIPQWERVRNETGLLVKWQIVTGEELPYEDETFDVLTSFSVIEHQRNKSLAIDEVARVLREGGMFAVSFDICEPKMGMTFPDWNGKALTMNEFEDLVWKHIAFDNGTGNLEWNLENIPEFIQWHLQSAPHHNYTVGAAILKKKDR